MKLLGDSEAVLLELENGSSDVESRVFGYSLNQKRAKAKLLKGAKRLNNLEVEERDGCVNLRFSGGAFYEVIQPLIRVWNLKVDEEILINKKVIKVIEVDKGIEDTNKHVDTKLVVMVDDKRIVIHAYNGTQNVMVQGKNYKSFAVDCLKPYFEQKIQQSLDKIAQMNNDVKDALAPNKTEKLKAIKLFKCPQCLVTTKRNMDLKVHMKTCHTKPGINSPRRNKALKLNNDDIEEVFGKIETSNGIRALDICNTETAGNLMPEVEDLLCCTFCEFDTVSQEELNNHIRMIHGYDHSTPRNVITENISNMKQLENDSPDDKDNKLDGMAFDVKDISLKEKSILCGECGKEFVNQYDCTTHMQCHESTSKIKCEKCDKVFNTKEDHENHKQTNHMSLKVDLNVLDQRVIKCETCKYICKYNIQLKKHIEKEHGADLKYRCKECEFSTNFVASAMEHKLEFHPDESITLTPKDSENFILKIVAEQTTSLSDEMADLKVNMMGAFKELATIFETCIGKLKEENNEKCKIMENIVGKLNDKVSKVETALNKKQTYKILRPVPKTFADAVGKKKIDNEHTKKKPAVSVQSPEPSPPPGYPKCPSPSTRTTGSTGPTRVTSSTGSRRSSYLSLPKALYIGDSVGHTANLREVEKASNCRIRSAKAYSSTSDSGARWPVRNFKDVVQNNLNNPGQENYDILILSSPTVDLTNLDTARYNQEEIEKKVVESCQNMFNTVHDALTQHKDLSKVILMEHSPRFDDQRKTELAVVANTILSQLWVTSPFKNKIVIGRHSLVSLGIGSSFLARYKDLATGRYDGVHLYGRTGVRDYTNSVKSILMMAQEIVRPGFSNDEDDHTNCEQARYQWRRAQYNQSHRYSHRHVQSPGVNYVSTQNRFDLFNNQGNY